jgi:CesT_Tir_1
MVMISREGLESYLIRMDMEWEELEEGMFLVRGGDGNIPVVVHHTDPVLLLRLKVMDLPEGDGQEEFYRTLLEFNATDIVHGAYGIEENELILSDTLELATLDFEELQASVESLQYAVSSHVSKIRDLAGLNESEGVVSDEAGSDDAGEEGAEG